MKLLNKIFITFLLIQLTQSVEESKIQIEIVSSEDTNIVQSKPETETAITEIVNAESKLDKSIETSSPENQSMNNQETASASNNQPETSTTEDQKINSTEDKKNEPVVVILPIENEQETKPKSINWMTSIGFFLIVFFIFALMLTSLYFRSYVQMNRKVPFETPSWLNFLFPKPVNYETEISVLCSKYMNSV